MSAFPDVPGIQLQPYNKICYFVFDGFLFLRKLRYSSKVHSCRVARFHRFGVSTVVLDEHNCKCVLIILSTGNFLQPALDNMSVVINTIGTEGR